MNTETATEKFNRIYAAAKLQVAGLYEELQNIEKNQPVFPGDVISHAQAKRLSQWGYISRDQNGYWIRTDKPWNGMQNAKSS